MRAAAFAAIVLLAGCNAAMPQQQASRPTQADDPSNACFNAIPGHSELTTIAAKIPLRAPDSATIEQLSNKDTPTDAEKAELSKWAKMRSQCADLGRAFRAQYAPPGWSNTFDQLQTGVLQAIAALYGGGTYAEFNTQRQRTAATARNGFESANQNDQRSRQAQQQAQQSEAIQSLQMMQLMQSMQPRPAPLPMPAAPVFCNSNRIGNQVNTVCR